MCGEADRENGLIIVIVDDCETPSGAVNYPYSIKTVFVLDYELMYDCYDIVSRPETFVWFLCSYKIIRLAGVDISAIKDIKLDRSLKYP